MFLNIKHWFLCLIILIYWYYNVFYKWLLSKSVTISDIISILCNWYMFEKLSDYCKITENGLKIESSRVKDASTSMYGHLLTFLYYRWK